MDTLLRDAQVVVLPTFQSTGLKLKLLSSLFKGRHVLANEAMVKGTGLRSLVILENDADPFREKVRELARVPYTQAHRDVRKEVLIPRFDNMENARRCLELLGI